MLKTRITDKFRVSLPIMSAPMSRHSGGKLAGAMTRAGGVGLFGGTNPAGEDWLREQINTARSMSTGRPFGVGFITHLIPVFPALFEVAISEKVPVVAFSFADPSPWAGRAKAAGATVICQVQSVKEAEKAVAAGTDVLVVQGNEAGGHTGPANLMPLLARVVGEYPQIPVMAAGGIASGGALAAVLAAGADGAWMGTPLLATYECLDVSDDYKNMLVAAKSEDTVFTQVFDILDEEAFSIPPWPSSIAGRAIRNDLLKEWHGKEGELRGNLGTVLTAYVDAINDNDTRQTAVWAGESVDFVHSIRHVSDIVNETCVEAERILRASSDICH